MDWHPLVTAGNVDDGKSTLLGRLLFDGDGLKDDERARLGKTPTLARLFDGLRAERERGITMDAAYRYFDLNARRFVLIDCPGHEEFLGQFITAATHAATMVLVVDVSRPLARQTSRHLTLCAKLGVAQVYVCLNKMDAVGYDKEVYESYRRELLAVAARLNLPRLDVLPVSALHGDNVVHASHRMPWYRGAPLVDRLRKAKRPAGAETGPLRVLIQKCLDSRHALARVVGGELKPGERLCDPRGGEIKVMRLGLGEKVWASAAANACVTIEFSGTAPAQGSLLHGSVPLTFRPTRDAEVYWLDKKAPLTGERRLVHLSGVFAAKLSAGPAEVSPPGWEGDEGSSFGKFLALQIECALATDRYRDNRYTGSSLIVDGVTHQTLGFACFR